MPYLVIFYSSLIYYNLFACHWCSSILKAIYIISILCRRSTIMVSNILRSSYLFEIYALILSHESTHIRFAPPTQRLTSFQQYPNIFQSLCLFLVFFYFKSNIYIIDLMYFNNCYDLKHLSFLLFTRNISRWVSFWMKVGSCCALIGCLIIQQTEKFVFWVDLPRSGSDLLRFCFLPSQLDTIGVYMCGQTS